MSKAGKKLFHLNRNEFIDRRMQHNVEFPELTIRVNTIDTVLLLLESQEEIVLINVLKHIVDYVRRSDGNVRDLLKEKRLLQLLLRKQFYRANSSVSVRRLSLYLATFVVENMDCLVELETFEMQEIIALGLSYYIEQEDDICCEYLSVIINKCAADPQCVDMVLNDSSFLLKYFSAVNTSTDPDTMLHSFELLHKMLLLQSAEEKQTLTSLETFPINRLLGELNCEHFEIRKAALQALQCLVVVPSASNVFSQGFRGALLMEQLTRLFSESSLSEELSLLVEILAVAMDHDFLVSLFFDLNLFDKYLKCLNVKSLDSYAVCKALRVLVECAKYGQFLARLVSAEVTEKLLECLLKGAGSPAAHILQGLNRLMKSATASKLIIESYDVGFLRKVLELLPLKEIGIKVREQAANLLESLLSCAFHNTATKLLALNLPSILASVFVQEPAQRSIDLLLSLLNIVEALSTNADYRLEICMHQTMVAGMGILLKNWFSTAILVSHLLRCLCSLVNEEVVHEQLLHCSLCSSLERALQSASNQVKTAATNFIMQTSRFPIFVTAYKESGVMEVLLLHQRHAICVVTWNAAIESILSKNPTMKFCIRNSLGFTDITAGSDFMVSKRRFEDFRVFQCILEEDVSPLHPVIVVNFNRPKSPAELVVKVSTDSTKGWCYCRSPGDEFLPRYLEEVRRVLKSENLAISPVKIPKNVDFDNLAKRAKVIAQFVEQALGHNLKRLDLNGPVECFRSVVKCHLKELCMELHCSFIPLGRIRSGCEFERAILFKSLADQVGLPCTLQRSVDGRVLYNEVPLPLELEQDTHCDKQSLSFIPWRLLRPTHLVDLMYNVGALYPLQSRQAFQYLRVF